MAQIGWSQESKLLSDIIKKLQRLTQVMASGGTTTTTTTAAP